jgi:cyclic beta-1,2-glucan synthetase
VEPYVVAADVYRLPGKIGQGGWSWYTGSAAWMYRAWIEDILGLRITMDTMRLNPVFPDSWGGFNLQYTHGEAVYDIRVENGHGCGHGVESMEMDGQAQANATISLDSHCVKHHVIVRMGAPTP